MKRKALVLPAEVDLTIRAGKNDRCSFSYRESFPSAKVVAATAAMVEAAVANGVLPPGVKFRRDGKNAFVIEGENVARSDVGNMMFGEFLLWATIADATLRDLIGLSIRLGQKTVA